MARKTILASQSELDALKKDIRKLKKKKKGKKSTAFGGLKAIGSKQPTLHEIFHGRRR